MKDAFGEKVEIDEYLIVLAAFLKISFVCQNIFG